MYIHVCICTYIYIYIHVCIYTYRASEYTCTLHYIHTYTLHYLTTIPDRVVQKGKNLLRVRRIFARRKLKTPLFYLECTLQLLTTHCQRLLIIT